MRRVEKYLEVRDAGCSKTGRTRIFIVWQKNEKRVCGEIKWYGGFRKYCFFQDENTLCWDSDGLRLIAEFCDDLNKKHRSGSRARAFV